ncbi:MAG TPA: rod shape-determining protein RodA [Thermoanaerobaculia bacterium]|nr:rod shape-determining protein RodA [Thermoanaerobaculia bacterium]HQR67456.1 rod shape-determining protein RodA [Thermoanaerobaculia bacterium]
MSRLSEVLPRKLDLRILGLALALTLIGVAMVHSTTSETARGDLGGKQALFALLALGVAALFVAVDYRLLLEYSPALYGVTLVVLAALPLFGSRIAGARSWIRFGGFQVQPSELARLSIALLLAFLLERDDRKLLRTRTLLILCGAVGLPMLLVLLQPDTGVALTYVPFLLAALFFGGMRAKWWATLVVVGVLAVGGSWFLLKDYQKDRIRTFLDPNLAVRGAGYQVRQARIAIGSGGIFGKGWKQGTQSRLGFLPVRHTDFVFAALAEEWGFAGVAVVLGLYGALMARAFKLAHDARDRGGAMLVLLLATNIAGEAIWNVAMNVGLLPTTGITLPFISYGGSSLIATWGMVGLMLSVAYRRFVNV